MAIDIKELFKAERLIELITIRLQPSLMHRISIRVVLWLIRNILKSNIICMVVLKNELDT